MKTLLCSILILFPVIGVVAPGDKTEQVRLSYELILSKCKADSCHSDSAAHGDVYIILVAEDPTYSWGYEAIEEDAGTLAYQLRFNASRASKGKRLMRTLVLGFSGRIGTLTGKQVTWGEKDFTHNNWNEFGTSSVSGAAYSEEGQTITPTFQVTQVKVLPLP